MAASQPHRNAGAGYGFTGEEYFMPVNPIERIKKRNGDIVPFEPEKIIQAIMKAMASVGIEDRGRAQVVADAVVEVLAQRFSPPEIPTVEDVQDEVESQMIDAGLKEAAKSYIIYRQEHQDIRNAKAFYNVQDDLKLSINAIKVLGERYLGRDMRGRITELPSQMFLRVAEHIAAAEEAYGGRDKAAEASEIFYEVMSALEFLPNSPTLMNAGTGIGQLAACFVLPVEDSLESIFEAVKRMALIHQSGGGTGFSFSKLRPQGDRVKSTRGVASGPVSFMKVFDVATDVVKQGGRRRGANMAILDISHPDIPEFITAKRTPGAFANFNFSVAVSDAFMTAVKNKGRIDFIHPGTGEIQGSQGAADLFDTICALAWETGDPGLIFIDRINEDNPTPALGRLEATNPCSEQPLLPNESCVLGSINLAKVVKRGEIDWLRLKELVRIGVRFLDDVIDVSEYIFTEIEAITKANRKIGLGIMGFADMLIKLGIAYDSVEAANLAEKVMGFISQEGRQASIDLAEKRGSFPNISDSIWPERGISQLRNATVTTIAPTGTLSIIANCSSGIEPLFAVAYIRRVLEGSKLVEVNPEFERLAQETGIYSKELLYRIAKHGSLRTMPDIPAQIANIIPIASDIDPIWHVKMQAAFQKHTDNATSKTANLAEQSSIDDVRNVFMSAFELGCKGITVYRYGSKPEQVLSYADDTAYFEVTEEFSGGCPGKSCEL